MTWKCVDCNVPENRDPQLGPARSEEHVVVDAVCHHCGRPLCRKNRVLILDEVFSDGLGLPTATSFHCKECYRTYHDRVQAIDELPGVAAAARR